MCITKEGPFCSPSPFPLFDFAVLREGGLAVLPTPKILMLLYYAKKDPLKKILFVLLNFTKFFTHHDRDRKRREKCVTK